MSHRIPRVLAASYREYVSWCEHHNRSPRSAVYVHSVDQLRGLRAEDVIEVPGWDDRQRSGRHAIVTGQIRAELDHLRAVSG